MYALKFEYIFDIFECVTGVPFFDLLRALLQR